MRNLALETLKAIIENGELEDVETVCSEKGDLHMSILEFVSQAIFIDYDKRFPPEEGPTIDRRITVLFKDGGMLKRYIGGNWEEWKYFPPFRLRKCAKKAQLIEHDAHGICYEMVGIGDQDHKRVGGKEK